MVRVVLDGGVTFGPPVCNGPIWGYNDRSRVIAHRYQRRVFEQQPGVPYRLVRFEADGGDVEVGLETALHQRFADRRLNLVNAHREFFYVRPSEVKAALLELRGDLLTFVEAPEALEWHQSQNTRRGAASTRSVT